ncbi:CSMD1-like protein, partial [Mya arenaria]
MTTTTTTTTTTTITPLESCWTEAVGNATFTPDVALVEFNHAVTYTCDLAYTRSSGDLTRTCQSDFSWSGSAPVCTNRRLFRNLRPRSACIQENSTNMTSNPDQVLHNLGGIIDYTCNLGYNYSSGDVSRTCLPSGLWSGVLPECVRSACIQENSTNMTSDPDQVLHNFGGIIDYTCNLGFKYSSGDVSRTCLPSGLWSGVLPECVRSACIQENSTNMTSDPNQVLHNFGGIIDYTCNLGFKYSSGDVSRTCLPSGLWSGVLPECVIVTCDPPPPVPNAIYEPIQSTHDWNTAITYTCGEDYHYLGGSYRYLCNESGSFPPSDMNCSAPHFINLAVGEPGITWLNETVPSAVVSYDFDGYCDVNLTQSPSDKLTISYQKVGNQIQLKVAKTAYTLHGLYTVSMNVFRSLAVISRKVFVGQSVWGFQAWLDNPIFYIGVGDTHHFEANATQGTDVTLTWSFATGEGGTVKNTYTNQEFAYGDVYYTFENPKTNITVTASNLVSSASAVVEVEVLYYINNIVFETDTTLTDPTTPVDFRLLLGAAADLPMHIVSITIDYKHGTNSFEKRNLFEDATVPDVYYFRHLFDVQGEFIVVSSMQNVLGVYNRSITVDVWNSLRNLTLEFVNGNGAYITNTTAEFKFAGVPEFGFKYSIDYGDGSIDSYTADDIMYSFYNLSTFTHIYTKAGLYTLTWTSRNGYAPYNRLETISILIQNKVPVDGYKLEPSLKKYPWLNLQSMDISVNITLNATSHLPTDATCVFWPDDGEPSVPGLVYDGYFFQHKHRYLQEGVFNSSFNCSNEVSWFIYQYLIEVEKFKASYMSVDYHQLVPLNGSDSVTVFFHVQTGGFALIPLAVQLTWNYGILASKRRRRATTTFDQVTYSNTYFERGDYTFSLYAEALTTNTTSYLEYPIRLGIMHFEYSSNISFINYTNVRYTMHGELGSFHKFTMDFDDTTPNDHCNATDINGCFIEHVCPTWGYHLVTATASNGTFIEFDQVNMTCENPIVNLTTDIPLTVSIPDGIIDAMLRIPATALYLPVLHCRWNMGDPIDRHNYQLTQTVSYTSPFLFANFQYIALGIHTITIHCWNLINETFLEQHIVVTNSDFQFTGVFDRYYSQSEGPMYISSMVDTEIFSRLEILAASHAKTHFNQWQFSIYVGETNPNRQGLLFPHGVVKETTHHIVLRVVFAEEPTNAIFEPTYVKFVMPIPHAEIVGGSRRYVSRGIVTLDAYSVSFDPVFPSTNTLTFTWDCQGYDVASFDEAGAETRGQTCSTSEVSPGVLTVNTAGSQEDFYVVVVMVNNNRGGVASFTQILGIKNTNELSLRCTINCLAKVAVTSKIQLTPVLTDNCPASFTWTLKKHDGFNFIPVDLTSISETGNGNRSLAIGSKTLLPGTRYLVSLTMVKYSVSYGPAYYEFVTNLPPQGGHCRVIPYDIYRFPIMTASQEFEAGMQKFNMTCIDWKDEGWTDSTFSTNQPLLYYFYVQYSHNDYERQILYFDPGATSNLVSFQVGDPKQNYEATVVMRISDIFGDYIELKYNVTSKPTLTTQDVAALNTTSAQLQLIMNFVSQFDDEMIKANRTADYRTLCRRAMDVTSIYNKLELNMSSDIVVTPEYLTSLGYQTTEDGELLTWSDFWELIVDVADTTIADYLMK